MTPLTWDAAGTKEFQSGVDRGVLFVPGSPAVSWSGLVSVEEVANSTESAYYFDGVKYLDEISPGDFSAKLKAYTYPDEFEIVLGAAKAAGLSFHDQPAKQFSMSYRTKLGNDLEGLDYGYKLHLLYNLVVVPDNIVYLTQAATPAANEFGWTITATPPSMSGRRPTAHLSIDSTETSPAVLQSVENLIYGTDTTDASLPTVQEIATLFGATA